VNPIRNNVLLAYLGNYGPFDAGNDNIPEPWTMISNHIYLGNLPPTFPKTLGLVA
jgi:hypothetical protein